MENSKKTAEEIKEELLKLEEESFEQEKNDSSIISNLGKIKTEEQIKQEKAIEAVNRIQETVAKEYRDIFPDALPSKSEFYEKNRKHEIRACTTSEIKYYSSLKEEDILDVDEKVNGIIDSCVRITLGDGRIGNYKDISLTDKIFFIFAIRDLTLIKRNQVNKLVHRAVHPTTGEEKKIEINKDVFNYYKIPNGIAKWYDSNERCFIIRDESFGKKPLKIYIPTIGATELVRNHVKKLAERRKSGESIYIDEQFYEFLQYMIKDWREVEHDFDVFVEETYADYKSWSEDKHMTMVKAISKLEFGVKPTITVNFERGGSVEQTLSFPSYKSLFDFSSKSDELLSD